MTTFYSDVEPFSKYSPVMLHLSPATRILNETPDKLCPLGPCVSSPFLHCIILLMQTISSNRLVDSPGSF